MRFFSLLAAAAGAAVGLAGCPRQVADFRVTRLTGFDVSAIDSDGFQATVRCEIENPNALDAEVRELSFEAYTGEHLLGRGRTSAPLTVPAHQRAVLALPFRVQYRTLPPDLPQRVKDGRLPLRSVARLRAATAVGTFGMTLESRDRVPIDRALRAAIGGSFRGAAMRILGVSLAGFELRQVRLRVRVRARNLFPFPIRIRQVRYRLAINGSPFGEGQRSAPLPLPARGSAETDFLVAAAHGAVGRAIAALLGSDPEFRVAGAVWIDPIGGVDEIPFDLTADSSVFSR